MKVFLHTTQDKFVFKVKIEKSFNIASGLVTEAKARLDVFPDSRFKAAILAMSHYTLKRNKYNGSFC